MCACWCVHGVGVVSAGLREPLRKGYSSLAEELTHLVPITYAFFWGATDRLRILAVPYLSTMKGSKNSAVLCPSLWNPPAFSLHGLYSPVLFAAVT